MNDLAKHTFDMLNAINRAKAAELSESPKGRWDMPSATHAPDCNVNQGFNKGEICCCHGNVAPHKNPLRAEVVCIGCGVFTQCKETMPNGDVCPACPACIENGKIKALRWPPDVAPHIAKIPLRAEVRDMLIAAKLYDEHADLLKNGAELHEHYAKSNREQAAKLEQLARDARAQAENLERMANL